ncbi:MAG: hypothetical protein JOZ90_03890 [Alphaproteobacteria bacterium]|nr:hypothetical protein [Alphaproteobacteria bacterium]MBV9372772.1 hypothetical protein [Alphaproteobacteria bacterium]MBV9900221.1 hypothetical protein [Alphaproteobacteria bacterium]
MKARLLPIALVGAALAGCATGRDDGWQPEFVGRTIRVEAANGQVTNLSFRRDGGVVARFGERETRGDWALERGRLCFTWGGSFRECWPHGRPFRPGRTESIRSDRGNQIRVTLLR